MKEFRKVKVVSHHDGVKEATRQIVHCFSRQATEALLKLPDPYLQHTMKGALPTDELKVHLLEVFTKRHLGVPRSDIPEA